MSEYFCHCFVMSLYLMAERVGGMGGKVAWGGLGGGKTTS